MTLGTYNAYGLPTTESTNMIQPSNLSRQELLDRLQQLLEEERDLVQRLRRADTSDSGPADHLREQRQDAWKSLRGSVVKYGDIISPIDVDWDAAT